MPTSSGIISPAAFHPMLTTFIVWVMLTVGGSGNNKERSSAPISSGRSGR